MKKITLAILLLALMASDNELTAAWGYPAGMPTMPTQPYSVPGQYGLPYGMMPPAPGYVYNQSGVPSRVPNPMPYGLPQGVPYGAGMPVPPMPAAPPLPQYPVIPPQYVPAPVAPYVNDAGQGLYNQAVPQYNEALTRVNDHVAAEKQAAFSKLEATENSVSTGVNDRVAAGEQAIIYGKVTSTATSAANEASKTFDNAISRMSGILG